MRSCPLPNCPFGWQDDDMKVLIKLVITAVALWLATLLISGIQLHAHTTAGTIVTPIVVALIFGVINTVLKPIAKAVGCLAYAVTFGLISIVVNGLLFWLTSWVAGRLSVPFHITGFVPAMLGALDRKSTRLN